MSKNCDKIKLATKPFFSLIATNPTQGQLLLFSRVDVENLIESSKRLLKKYSEGKPPGRFTFRKADDKDDNQVNI